MIRKVEKQKAGICANIYGRTQFPPFVSPHYYILQAILRGGLFGRLYTEIQTKRMLYRKSYVTLHPKAYEV